MNKLSTLCFILLTSITFGQDMKFTGTVNDTINDQPLENAVVMAVRLSDGLLLGYTRTREDGYFDLRGVPIDTMELIISHYKFDEKRYYIIGSDENTEIIFLVSFFQNKQHSLMKLSFMPIKNPSILEEIL